MGVEGQNDSNSCLYVIQPSWSNIIPSKCSHQTFGYHVQREHCRGRISDPIVLRITSSYSGLSGFEIGKRKKKILLVNKLNIIVTLHSGFLKFCLLGDLSEAFMPNPENPTVIKTWTHQVQVILLPASCEAVENVSFYLRECTIVQLAVWGSWTEVSDSF